MWDKRVVEQVAECGGGEGRGGEGGTTLWLFPSKTLLLIPLGPLQVFMSLILTGIEGFYEMNWPAC
jgi:hypothetical protein